MPHHTPLHDHYAHHGGKLVEFAGWSLPVQFEGVMAEHTAVRERAGLFDVSHMARFEVSGSGAEAFLDSLLTNDIKRLAEGALFYTVLCDERGGCIDDLVVYRFADRFLVVANAANHDSVWEWFRDHATSNAAVTLTDLTATLAHLALQGPAAVDVLQPLVEADLGELGYYEYVETTWRTIPLLVSRNGYTGEDGFELYIESDRAGELWQSLFVAGGGKLVPAGLGARDTLRLEVAYPLYGHELGRDVSPLEAGLGWVVKTKNRTFPGSDTLRLQKKSGASRKLVGLEFEGRVIGRQGATILHENDAVGVVTSGTFGPTVKKGIALGFVPRELAEEGTRFRVDVRGRRIDSRVVSLPFYTDGTHL